MAKPVHAAVTGAAGQIGYHLLTEIAIEARGASSAVSAANAVVDCVRSLASRTPPNDWHSAAVVSHGEYGIPEGLVFSFPLRGGGENWHVVAGLDLNPFAREKLHLTTQELLLERTAACELLET
jgi:malate dehydrogenase